MATTVYPIPITAEGLARLQQVRRTPDARGDYPDLGQLADRFGMSRQAMNLCLDALLGRTPEQAHASLVGRFGVPTDADLHGGGRLGHALKAFLNRMGWGG